MNGIYQNNNDNIIIPPLSRCSPFFHLHWRIHSYLKCYRDEGGGGGGGVKKFVGRGGGGVGLKKVSVRPDAWIKILNYYTHTVVVAFPIC